MKSMILVALALVAVAVAAPPTYDDDETVAYNYEQAPQGSYGFGFQTKKGIERTETGDLKQVLDDENKPHDVVVVRGSYSYYDNDGNQQVITYTADENGYKAEGPGVPKVARR